MKEKPNLDIGKLLDALVKQKEKGVIKSYDIEIEHGPQKSSIEYGELRVGWGIERIQIERRNGTKKIIDLT